MPARKPRRRPSGPPAVPLWLLLLLTASLGGLIWVRRAVEPSPPPNPPRRAPAALVQEPPPFPETPPEERAAEPPPRAPREPGESVPPEPHRSAPAPRRHEAQAGGPRVALVLDDVGYRLPPLEEACAKLPPEVTFAVLPHLPESLKSDALLHARGFPILLHAPMEPLPGPHPGPGQGALLVGMPGAEVGFLLDQDLAQVPHAEGVNNHMGSRATADAALMREVMAFLRSKGLYFLDSRTTTASVAFRTAREEGVDTAQKTLFLDDVDDPGSITRYFGLLMERARREGEAVGIGHLRPNTVAVLAEQIPLWRARGVAFVPLREVVR